MSPFDHNGENMPLSGPDIQFLTELSIKAGKTAVEMRSGVDISTKTGPEDLVTCADKKLSEILLANLKERFPADKILSEEELWENVSSQTRRWYIDPIDGTKHYVKQTGRWSVMLGLVGKEQPEFGCFYIPDQDIVYFGGTSTGSWQMTGSTAAEKIEAVKPIDLTKPVRVLMSSNDLKQNSWVAEQPGIEIVTASSIGLDISELVKGNADVFVHIRPTLKSWDTAAPAAVALGCGMEVGTENGNGIPYLAEDPTHKPCIVMGRPGCINWWKAIYANRPVVVTAPMPVPVMV